jgi:hypothetical protein
MAAAAATGRGGHALGLARNTVERLKSMDYSDAVTVSFGVREIAALQMETEHVASLRQRHADDLLCRSA